MKASDAAVLVNSEAIENACCVLFDYSALYWLGDLLFCSGNVLKNNMKKVRIYSYYPKIAVKDVISWANKTADTYSIDIQTKSIKVTYADPYFAKPLMDISYPGLVLGIGKQQNSFSVNVLGLKITLAETMKQTKAVLAVRIFYIVNSGQLYNDNRSWLEEYQSY